MTVISGFWNRSAGTFRAAVARGASSTEAAAELGITRNAAIGYADRNGMTWAAARTKLPPERRPPVEFPRHGHCLWPHGDPGENGFSWCGAPATIGRPYCEMHQGRAYRRKAPE